MLCSLWIPHANWMSKRLLVDEELTALLVLSDLVESNHPWLVPQGSFSPPFKNSLRGLHVCSGPHVTCLSLILLSPPLPPYVPVPSWVKRVATVLWPQVPSAASSITSFLWGRVMSSSVGSLVASPSFGLPLASPLFLPA